VALADRARKELVASGARRRRHAMSGPDSLTPAELRTARMAADGQSNREIAQSLFVSTKTVEAQLSQAYSKLSIHSCRDLATALTRPPAGTGKPNARG
jgi:DNA-binding CsgD family transcriptional regulator